MRLFLGSDAIDMDVFTLIGRVLSCGMDDQYEERLKEVFESFDGSGAGSLCPEELSDLCQALHLEEATPTLLHVLLQGQNDLTGRIVFNQFKDALIQVLSSTIAAPPPSQEPGTTPDSPEVHPKFVRGSKRYGRRSTPEFIESVTEFSEVISADATEERGAGDNDDTVPRKRERWNANESNAEEYEAEGQLQLWNPDEPGTPRGSAAPLPQHLEDRLREACQGLALPWDAAISLPELLELCEHLGLEVTEDVLQTMTGDGVMSVQEFVSRVVNSSKPPTPSASTPYRQLKRHHSTQPFDEAGRRMAAPSAMSSTIGTRLFSCLDDGTGYTPVENVLDAWMEEGIENSPEILQALDFDLEGKLSLRELTVALENELLITKNGIHQAALASFKAEIRHLLERVDLELREKEKIRSDLEKAEKIKTQLATEVDEHHSAIERMNDLNIRKLEQDHRERLAAVRSELLREMSQVQQQAGQQREELEIQIEKIREDETFLRDHLSITVKENRRLEMELLDSTEKLVEAENQVSKLQKNLDNILKEKFGDLDPGSAEFFLQEERLQQLRSGYEEQCRTLQDRIDELQAQLQEFHSLGRAPQLGSKPSLMDEFESKSPGMESDPGIGSEEGQPFNMSLEAEMMLEQLKEQHLQEVENLRAQLESKIIEFEQNVEEQKSIHEEHREAISLQYQEEIEALREEMSSIQNRAQGLQIQLEHAEQERASLEERQAGEREELANQQDEEVATLRQELLQAHTHVADLEDQLKALEDQQAEMELEMEAEKEELKRLNALECNRLEEEHEQIVEARLEEERKRMQEERTEVEKKLLEEWKRESEVLQRSHEETMRAKVEELSVMFQAEREELEMSLTEEWERKRAQLDEQNNESLQAVLEEEMLRLVREHEERESRLRVQWDLEKTQLQDDQEASFLARLAEEKEKLQQQHEQREERLMEDWKKERMQLEEDYERMIQEKVNEEKEKLEAEKEELEKRLVRQMEDEKNRLEESHREAVQELCTRHKTERDQLSSLLDKLRDNISEERKELESHFSQRIKEVENRFSSDQEAVSKQFQTDVANLEQHYHDELKAMSDRHAEQKIKWEMEVEKAMQEAEEQRSLLQESMKKEREFLHQEWAKEQEQLQSAHKVEIDELMEKNLQLQKDLESSISSAQTKEIELSRKLNELHNRLVENLDTKDELLAQSENKAQEIELLLNQAVEDFKQEKAELQSCLSELEVKYTEALLLSDKHLEERIELLSNCDELKAKVDELERLLKQSAVDFDLERQEMQDNISDLEVRLQENLTSCEMQENEKVELISERDHLYIRIEKIQAELDKLLESVNGNGKAGGSNEDSPEGEEPPEGLLDTCPYEEQELCSQQTETLEDVVDNETSVIPENSYHHGVESVTVVEHDDEVETLAECDQDVTVASEDLPIPVEESTIFDEQAQDDDLEMIAESPDECSENIVTSYDVVDGEIPDAADQEDTKAVWDIEQNNAYEEVVDEPSEDVEVLLENVTVSVEACNDVSPVSEDGYVFMEDQSPAKEEIDEDSNPETVVIADDIPKSSVERENPEYVVDEVLSENLCHGNVQHSSSAGPENNELFELDCGEGGLCETYAVDAAPQDTHVEKNGSLSPCLEDCQESVVETTSPEETQDPDYGAKQERFLEGSHSPEQKLVTEQPQQYRDELDEQDGRICNGADQMGQSENLASMAELQFQYSIATEENLLLHQKVALLQEKTDTLESLLVESTEKMAAGRLAFEENCSLKAKILMLMEEAEDMVVKSEELTDLQIRYEECICENAKLGEQNCKLEKRILDLENKMHIIQDFQDQQVALVDEITRMREENCTLMALVSEFEKQDELLLTLQQETDTAEEAPKETFLDFNSQLEAKIQAVSDLENCCSEFEKQNGKLRKSLTELQDKSLMIHERMKAHRSEASRLAEENLVLRHKISALKEEDLRESQEEMLLKLEHFRKEKIAAQKLADNYKRQITELRLRSQQLESENGFLAQKNTENARGVEELGQQLEALLRQKEKKETVKEQQNLSTEERNQMAVCVSALEAELTKALEGSALLEESKAQLSQQLSSLREKVEPMESQLSQLLQERQSADKQTQSLLSQLAMAQERFQALDETLQAVNIQSSRLKSDLRVTQQEKEALKQEVISLHKQLQNANDKNQVLEIALHSSGFQSQHKKLYRDELARLVEQEQELVRKENDRLQMEVHNTKGDLLLSREKIRQLEAQVLSLKQQKQQSQSSLVRALEQDKVSLRRELESLQKELLVLRSRACEEGSEIPRELEMLRQENEVLKTQTSRLHSQLIETLQAQLGGLLPPSPRRMPGDRRGPHRGEDPNPENMPDERMMMRMEERMREVELSLHNVKLLLKEKVYQLKEQLHRNGKSDVLIKDLYMENAKLQKALEMTDQHQKITEKKNYLLEEKISSLNKIVRDLNPAPLTPVPFPYTRS